MAEILPIFIIVISAIFGTVENYGLQSSNHGHPGQCNPHLVKTKLGLIQGESELFKTRLLERKIYSFRGIRYAEAPIGDLRFKNPVPVKSWSNVFNATAEGPGCPQPIRVNFPISEDCLRLNIYTPQDPCKKSKLLPVMIYFHPGGFYGVSGQSLFSGPQYILDKDIVLITLNYRLATLGFLSTGDKHAPGNFGLKDQVEAMRFVKEHIHAFGGDPSQITIWGYSAGASSIGLHLVSPMSHGLFHRVIVSSASPFGTWPYTPQKDLAIKQAQLVGCSTTDQNSAKIVECLRSKDAEDISTTFFSFQEIGQDPTLIWRPVVEPDFGGERFLSENPEKLMNEGKYMKVPVITGITDLEFAYVAYLVTRNETLLNIWNSNFSYAASVAFHYERDTQRSNEIGNALRQFYLGNDPISEKNVDAMGQMYADGVIGFQVHRFLMLMAQTNPNPIYYYKFDYKGRYSHYYLPNTNNQTLGAVHHDDLIYMLYNSLLFPYFQPNDPEISMVKIMTTMWTNFAIYGNPTPPGMSDTNWEPYSRQTKKYLNIDTKLTMKSKLFPKRYALWDRLFPLPN